MPIPNLKLNTALPNDKKAIVPHFDQPQALQRTAARCLFICHAKALSEKSNFAPGRSMAEVQNRFPARHLLVTLTAAYRIPVFPHPVRP